MTGALTAFDIRGANGLQLRDAWAAGPAAYLGIAVAGFPNLFVITGPGSPSVLASVLLAIEQHVEWLSGLLGHAQRNGITRIEADGTAQLDWVKRVAEGAEKTLFTRGNSWYLGANVPGKPRVFMPFADGFCVYEKICNDIAAEGYTGLSSGKGHGDGAMTRRLAVADKWYEVHDIGGGVNRILETHVASWMRCNMWLVRGRDHDILIDSGLGLRPLKAEIAALRERPVTSISTHCHFDHIGCTHEFAEQLGHHSEAEIHAAPMPTAPARGVRFACRTADRLAARGL